jgi:hypothetical protein
MLLEAYSSSLPQPKLTTDPCQLSSYFDSLCCWCLRQRLQNFENSRRPVVVFLFFVVE